MTLLERINHYNRQPDHSVTVVVGPNNKQWYAVTDEDGVLIDWFPTVEEHGQTDQAGDPLPRQGNGKSLPP